MSRHFYKSPVIRCGDLRRLSEQNSSLINRYGASQDEDVVIKGNFSFHRFSDGLSIHSSQATEQKDCSNCFELPAGLSFNFIFRGNVNVSLAGKHYCFAADTNKPDVPCAVAIALNQSDLLMRHMKKGMNLHKVNVFVPRQWLEDHCAGEAGNRHIDTLFHDHARVREWLPSKGLCEEVVKWFDMEASSSLVGQLDLEWRAIKLLALLLDEYAASNSSHQRLQHQARSLAGNSNLKHAVDSCMTTCQTVQEVAQALHISPSALQRRFRRSYDMTVIDYMRMRRLEQAKVALVRDGATIGEAAYLAGYNHSSNFITAFKKHFSVTPMKLLRSRSLSSH